MSGWVWVSVTCPQCLKVLNDAEPPSSAVPPDPYVPEDQRMRCVDSPNDQHGYECVLCGHRLSSPPPSASVELPEDRAMVSDYSDPEQLAGRSAKALPHLSARSVEEVARLIEAECQRSSASGEGERQESPFGHENTSDDPALAQAVAEYALNQMGMPSIAVDQEQNWIAGHLFTFAYRREATLRSALTALVETLRVESRESSEAARSPKWPSEMGRHGLRKEAQVRDEIADRIAAALASASSGDAGTGVEAAACEDECNPYIASCGAKFCSFDEMSHHEATHGASPKAGPA